MTRDHPSGDLVDRLRRFCFHLLRYPNYGALTSTPTGLSPAEHASLTWTHHRTEELTALNSRLEAEITQRKVTEDQLHQAQKMEALGQLTGGIAHDFNNLLTAVIGNLELAQKRTGNDPNTAELLRAALSAAERGATLIKDLLSFARRQPLHPKAVNVSAIVDDAEKILKQAIGPDIRLLIRAEPELQPAWVDPNQLALAFPKPGIELAGLDAERRQAADSLRESASRSRQFAV